MKEQQKTLTRANGKASADEKKMEQFKERLKSKDQLISGFAEENIGLKKT